MNKYLNKKTEYGGIKFDSKAEASRYRDLELLQKAGNISGLLRQISFVLAPSVKFDGAKKAKPALRYVADFMYSDTKTGKIVIEDCKGMITREFRIKQHLMKSVHGVEIKLTK